MTRPYCPGVILLSFIAILFFSSLPLRAQENNYGYGLQKGSAAYPFNKLHSYLMQNRFAENTNSLSNTASSSPQPNLSMFDNVGQNFLDSFKGSNLYLQLAGVAATCLIVPTGVDYHVEKYFNENETYGDIARPVVYTGMLLPFIASGSLYAYAKLKNDNQVLGASFAVMQASIVQLIYNSALKAVTGRPHPDWQHVSDMESLSKTFRFGFLRGGVFWGWPSGHTSATTAVVSALMGYYPNSTWLKIAGFGLMAYTIFGVSAFHRGGMHWFSDAVAAAFISYAVGSTIGKYYRSRFPGGNGSGANISSGTGGSFNAFSFSIQF